MKAIGILVEYDYIILEFIIVKKRNIDRVR